MQSLFFHLAIREEHVRGQPHQRKSHLALPEHVLRELPSDITELERDKLAAMVQECHYHDTVTFSNLYARLGSVAPPTGYAARMHEDTTFRWDMIDRYLFRGIAMARIRRRVAFTPEEKQHALVRWNQVIRDATTHPFTKEHVHAMWTESLGSFGWIGMYESTVQRGSGSVSSTPFPRKQVTYVLFALSGMDPVVYDEMYDFCVKELHGRVSVKEAMEQLAVYKEYTIQNRRRLLATALDVLGEQEEIAARATLPLTSSSFTPLQEIPPKIWTWLPPPPYRIPPTYLIPSPLPRGCPSLIGYEGFPVGACMTPKEKEQRGESSVQTILPDVEVTLDDFIPYESPASSKDEAIQAITLRDQKKAEQIQQQWKFQDLQQMIRYASCNDVLKHGKWSIRGPLQEISHDTLAHGSKIPTLQHSAHFYAAPNQYFPADESVSPPKTDVVYTWEDASVDVNRLAGLAYPTQTRPIAETLETSQIKQDKVVWDSTTYTPLLLRISTRDHRGWSVQESTKKRMTGFD